LAQPARKRASAAAQAAADANDGTDVTRANRLAATLATMQGLDKKTIHGVNVIRTAIVTAAPQELTIVMFPNKISQRVKRCLRREARKPLDMGVKTCLMHINI